MQCNQLKASASGAVKPIPGQLGTKYIQLLSLSQTEPRGLSVQTLRGNGLDNVETVCQMVLVLRRKVIHTHTITRRIHRDHGGCRPVWPPRGGTYSRRLSVQRIMLPDLATGSSFAVLGQRTQTLLPSTSSSTWPAQTTGLGLRQRKQAGRRTRLRSSPSRSVSQAGLDGHRRFRTPSPRNRPSTGPGRRPPRRRPPERLPCVGRAHPTL
jgi:hypothetical protein